MRPYQSLGYIMQRGGVMLGLGLAQSLASQVVGVAVYAAPVGNYLAKQLFYRILTIVSQQRSDVLLCAKVFGQRFPQRQRSDQDNRFSMRAGRRDIFAAD